jgi:hypothetical protein
MDYTAHRSNGDRKHWMNALVVHWFVGSEKMSKRFLGFSDTFAGSLTGFTGHAQAYLSEFQDEST